MDFKKIGINQIEDIFVDRISTQIIDGSKRFSSQILAPSIKHKNALSQDAMFIGAADSAFGSSGSLDGVVYMYGGDYMVVSGPSIRFKITDDGSTIIGSDLSDYVSNGNEFQVVGKASFSDIATAPTAPAGTNTTQIATTAFVNGGLATKENSFTKNTAFNKNFGITAGTVVEGGTLGSNAYSSTAYLPLSGGTVSGTISASPATTANQVVVKSQLDAAARPYKVYTALLSQSGTNAPIATVLENTLGGTVVWTRFGTGVYKATLSNAFTSNKTFLLTGLRASAGATYSTILTLLSNNASEIQLITTLSDAARSLSDGLLTGDSIEIRVYN